MSHPLVSPLQASLAVLATDFGLFLRAAFPVVHPGKELQDNWHIDAIVHVLEQCITGKTKRQIINMPPRHLKSYLCSVALPAFLLGRDPAIRIMVVSYSDDLAKPLAAEFRRLVDSPFYKQVFPLTVVSKSTEREYVTTQGGYRLVLSVEGGVTLSLWMIPSKPKMPIPIPCVTRSTSGMDTPCCHAWTTKCTP